MEKNKLVGKLERLQAADIVRGYAMLAMLVSHTSWRIPAFDYRVSFGWDSPVIPVIDTPQSFIGYVLQAATPIFFLLAGLSMGLFVHSRDQRGWGNLDITRFFLVRGVILVLLDLTLVNFDLYSLSYSYRISVLTAIGLGLIALDLLRRLNERWFAAVMVGLLLGTQYYLQIRGPVEDASLRYAVLMSPPTSAGWSVEFPLLPWLPIMMLGYASSRVAAQGTGAFARYALRVGLLALALWLIVVAFDGFGNLYREERYIFTKHPPDLAYLLVYVGLAFLLLWLHSRFIALNSHVPFRLIAALGQSALVFYVLHVKVLDLLFAPLNSLDLSPLALSFALTLLALPIMYIICEQYRSLRRRYPQSILQYI